MCTCKIVTHNQCLTMHKSSLSSGYKKYFHTRLSRQDTTCMKSLLEGVDGEGQV